MGNGPPDGPRPPAAFLARPGGEWRRLIPPTIAPQLGQLWGIRNIRVKERQPRTRGLLIIYSYAAYKRTHRPMWRAKRPHLARGHLPNLDTEPKPRSGKSVFKFRFPQAALRRPRQQYPP